METLLEVGILILILSNFFLIYIDRKEIKKVEELKKEVEEDLKLHRNERKYKRRY